VDRKKFKTMTLKEMFSA